MSSKTRLRSDACIKIVKSKKPIHVFPDEWFDLELSLDVPASFRRESRVVELESELCQIIQGRVNFISQNDSIQLKVEPSLISFPVGDGGSVKPHSMTIRCNLKSPVDKTPTLYYIRFKERYDPSTDSNTESLSPVVSDSIRIVSSKLEVKPCEWEDVFFKDEGGRDKCISVTVGLYDQNKNKIQQCGVPLHAELMYQDYTPVDRAGIFRRIGLAAGEQSTLDEDGEATLQFRVEDVSKNHTGQRFIVRISADENDFRSIAPAYTASVAVRSKRSKRKHVPPPISTPPPVQPQVQPIYAQNHSAHRVRQAMKGVVAWTDQVVNGLGPIKWNVLGYNPNYDGSIDWTKPYFSMVNPNNAIQQINTTYANETREQLRLLLSFIEESTNNMYRQNPRDNIHSTSATRYPPLAQPSIMAEFQETYNSNIAGPRSYHHTPSHQELSQPTIGQNYMQPMSHVQPTNLNSAPLILNDPPIASGTDPRHDDGLDQAQELQVERELEIEHRHRHRQGEVFYILARQYHSLRTREIFGCPAYCANKELLGFYRESSQKGGAGRFVSIAKHRADFGDSEMKKAKMILEDAIKCRSSTLLSMKEWGGELSNMVDHALSNDWHGKTFARHSSSSGSGSADVMSHPDFL